MRIGIFNVSVVYPVAVYRAKITLEYRVSFIFYDLRYSDIDFLILQLMVSRFYAFLRIIMQKFHAFIHFSYLYQAKYPSEFYCLYRVGSLNSASRYFIQKILPHSSYSHRYALHIKNTAKADAFAAHILHTFIKALIASLPSAVNYRSRCCGCRNSHDGYNCRHIKIVSGLC